MGNPIENIRESTINNDLSSKFLVIALLINLMSAVRNIHIEAIFPNLQYIFLLFILISSFIILIKKGISKSIGNSYVFIFYTLFCIFIVFSTLYSHLPALSFSRSIQQIISAGCILILASNVQDHLTLIKRLLKIIITFTFLSSIYSIIIYNYGETLLLSGVDVTQLKIGKYELNQRMYSKRVSSFLGNPNNLGIYIMISVLGCLYLISNRKSKALYITLIVLFLYTLFLTGSRASLIGLFCGFIIYINYTHVKTDILSSTLRFIVTICSIFIIFYILMSPKTIESIFSLIGRASSTLSGREIAWSALIEQINRTPFFGIGYRISTEAILEKNQIGVSNSHNLYLSVLSETGIIGFFFFISTYLTTFLFYFRYDKTKEKTIIISLLSSILINQFFEDMFAPLSFLFIFTMVLIISYEKLEWNKKSFFEKVNKRPM